MLSRSYFPPVDPLLMVDSKVCQFPFPRNVMLTSGFSPAVFLQSSWLFFSSSQASLVLEPDQTFCHLHSVWLWANHTTSVSQIPHLQDGDDSLDHTGVVWIQRDRDCEGSRDSARLIKSTNKCHRPSLLPHGIMITIPTITEHVMCARHLTGIFLFNPQDVGTVWRGEHYKSFCRWGKWEI